MVYHRSEGSGSRSDRNRGAPPSRSQPAVRNAFRNDGSFLEMFKKLQEGTSSGERSDSGRAQAEPESSAAKPDVASPDCSAAAGCAPDSKPPAAGPEASTTNALSAPKKTQPIVGKRRGGRVLPTGVVKKKRADEDEDEDKPKDPWSLYMAEVRRYKETSCEEDGKTRPLVK